MRSDVTVSMYHKEMNEMQSLWMTSDETVSIYHKEINEIQCDNEMMIASLVYSFVNLS